MQILKLAGVLLICQKTTKLVKIYRRVHTKHSVGPTWTAWFEVVFLHFYQYGWILAQPSLSTVKGSFCSGILMLLVTHSEALILLLLLKTHSGVSSCSLPHSSWFTMLPTSLSSSTIRLSGLLKRWRCQQILIMLPHPTPLNIANIGCSIDIALH